MKIRVAAVAVANYDSVSRRRCAAKRSLESVIAPCKHAQSKLSSECIGLKRLNSALQ